MVHNVSSYGEYPRYINAGLAKSNLYSVAMLPVRFVVPKSGRELSFHKAIVQEGEGASISLKYKKIRKGEKQERALIGLGALFVLLCLLIWVALRARKKRKARSRGVAS